MQLLTLIAIILFAPIPLFFIPLQLAPRLWRRFGLWNYALSTIIWIITAGVVYALRDAILTLHISPLVPLYVRSDIKWFLLLRVVGGILLLVGIIVSERAMHTLTWRITFALPQVKPDTTPSTLIAHGIYKKVRHPRYLGFFYITLGIALLTGYFAAALLFLYTLIMFTVIALLEERELKTRFGQSYINYMRTTSRFFSIF
ncbi:isoprenylcysteine carboxylmethyltransferase family protein [Candidatus Uhrbacteria bacterium]|nr:isoprenylcysteine carboxylmethyltransferase family protein [Candidatus Uhrbacteria bacterium]